MNSISNIRVLNVYDTAELHHLTKDRQPDEKAVVKCIRLSSIIAFIHHTLALISIMIFSKRYPDYFRQPIFKDVILLPGEKDFFTVFGFTIFIEFYGTVLSLHLAKKVTRVEVGKLQFAANTLYQ